MGNAEPGTKLKITVIAVSYVSFFHNGDVMYLM